MSRTRLARAEAHVEIVTVRVLRTFAVSLADRAEVSFVSAAVAEKFAIRCAPAVAIVRLTATRSGARTSQRSVGVRTFRTGSIDRVVVLSAVLARSPANAEMVTVRRLWAVVVSEAERTELLLILAAIAELRAVRVAPAIAVLRLTAARVRARASQWSMGVRTLRALCTLNRVIVDSTTLARLPAHVLRVTVRVRVTIVVSLAGRAELLLVVTTIAEGVTLVVAPAIAVERLEATRSCARTLHIRVRAGRTLSGNGIIVKCRTRLARAPTHVSGVTVRVLLTFGVSLADRAEFVLVFATVLVDVAVGVAPAVAVRGLTRAVGVGARPVQCSVFVRTRRTDTVNRIVVGGTRLARAPAHVESVTVRVVLAIVVSLADGT